MVFSSNGLVVRSMYWVLLAEVGFVVSMIVCIGARVVIGRTVDVGTSSGVLVNTSSSRARSPPVGSSTM